MFRNLCTYIIQNIIYYRYERKKKNLVGSVLHKSAVIKKKSNEIIKYIDDYSLMSIKSHMNI